MNAKIFYQEQTKIRLNTDLVEDNLSNNNEKITKLTDQTKSAAQISLVDVLIQLQANPKGTVFQLQTQD